MRPPRSTPNVFDTAPGDRWMICSDGLSSYVTDDKMEHVLGHRARSPGGGRATGQGEPRPGRPRQRHRRAGRHRRDDAIPRTFPRSRSVRPPARSRSTATALGGRCGFRHCCCIRSRRPSPTRATSSPNPRTTSTNSSRKTAARQRRRRVTWLVSIIIIVLAVVSACVVGYNWTQTHYYVGDDKGYVAIYRGVQQNIGPIQLSSLYEKTSIALSRPPRLQPRPGGVDHQREQPDAGQGHRRTAVECP